MMYDTYDLYPRLLLAISFGMFLVWYTYKYIEETEAAEAQESLSFVNSELLETTISADVYDSTAHAKDQEITKLKAQLVSLESSIHLSSPTHVCKTPPNDHALMRLETDLKIKSQEISRLKALNESAMSYQLEAEHTKRLVKEWELKFNLSNARVIELEQLHKASQNYSVPTKEARALS